MNHVTCNLKRKMADGISQILRVNYRFLLKINILISIRNRYRLNFLSQIKLLVLFKLG